MKPTKYKGKIVILIEERPDVMYIQFADGRKCWVEK